MNIPTNDTRLDRGVVSSPGAPMVLEAAWLRQLCLQAGADDAGFVEIERPGLASERPHIERAFPRTRSLISIVLRMNRDNVRSPARSVANNEFHHTTDEANLVARKIVTALERAGVRALCPPAGFPMEADRWMTERMWVVSHKPVAEAAGMGRMGIHRNLIHPKFGNFILLETILLGAEVSEYARAVSTRNPRKHIPPKSCARCKRKWRRYMSYPARTPRRMRENDSPTKNCAKCAAHCARKTCAP